MKIGQSLTLCWISALLIACGSDNTQLAEGGITGSGISVGPITGFGSVWVGGVRYDTRNAVFTRNGQIASQGQTDFQVGEIVNISGDINADGVTGVANKIEFDRKLLGLVTAKSTDGRTLEVLGQTIKTDTLTLFNGFNTLNELEIGNVLEISGSRNADDVLVASTIHRTQPLFVQGETELEIEGRIATVDELAQTFKVNGLTINYAQSILNGLVDLTQAEGKYIEIQSQQALINGRLVASKIEPKKEHPQLAKNSYTKMEGRLTRYNSSGAFSINGQEATLTGETQFINGDKADLGLEAYIGIAGFINGNGLLEANEITIRQSADPTSALYLEGQITTVSHASRELVILGTTITVDDSTFILDHLDGQISPIRFADLLAGNRLRITGRKLSNNKVLALRIDRNSPKIQIIETATGQDTSSNEEQTDTSINTQTTQQVTLTGTISAVDHANRLLTIGDNSVLVDSDTLYQGSQQNSMDLNSEALFNQLIVGESRTQIKGYSLGKGWIQAKVLKLLTE